MEKKYIDILASKYPSLQRAEIEQACLLAELRVGEENVKLAWRMVQCACLNKLKKNSRLNEKFPSYDVENFPEVLLKGDDPFATEKERKEEWEEVVKNLPKNAKKLVEITKNETEYFTHLNPHVSLWKSKHLSLLRKRIKERFIEWEWNHSEAGYYRARKILVKSLRRNRRLKKD